MTARSLHDPGAASGVDTTVPPAGDVVLAEVCSRRTAKEERERGAPPELAAAARAAAPVSVQVTTSTGRSRDASQACRTTRSEGMFSRNMVLLKPPAHRTNWFTPTDVMLALGSSSGKRSVARPG